MCTCCLVTRARLQQGPAYGGMKANCCVPYLGGANDGPTFCLSVISGQMYNVDGERRRMEAQETCRKQNEAKIMTVRVKR